LDSLFGNRQKFDEASNPALEALFYHRNYLRNWPFSAIRIEPGDPIVSSSEQRSFARRLPERRS
jgi:hypothetical protein